MRTCLVIAVAGVAICLTAAATTAKTAKPDVRHVVVHTPGPKWKKGVDFREQPGVAAHVRHYARLHKQGKLALGGPFLGSDAGGMMIPSAGIGLADVKRFAATDPAVRSGLLRFEIRRWYVAMSKR